MKLVDEVPETILFERPDEITLATGQDQKLDAVVRRNTLPETASRPSPSYAPDAFGSTPASVSSQSHDRGLKMIPFTLIYQSEGGPSRVSVRHYVIPQVGEKVIPPDFDKPLTVLSVEHDLNDSKIYVVLS
jgi:hypothetical protein